MTEQRQTEGETEERQKEGETEQRQKETEERQKETEERQKEREEERLFLWPASRVRVWGDFCELGVRVCFSA